MAAVVPRTAKSRFFLYGFLIVIRQRVKGGGKLDQLCILGCGSPSLEPIKKYFLEKSFDHENWHHILWELTDKIDGIDQFLSPQDKLPKGNDGQPYISMVHPLYLPVELEAFALEAKVLLTEQQFRDQQKLRGAFKDFVAWLNQMGIECEFDHVWRMLVAETIQTIKKVPEFVPYGHSEFEAMAKLPLVV